MTWFAATNGATVHERASKRSTIGARVGKRARNCSGDS